MHTKAFIPLGSRIEFIPGNIEPQAGQPKAYHGIVARINHLLNGSTNYTIQYRERRAGVDTFIERIINDSEGEVKLLSYY